MSTNNPPMRVYRLRQLNGQVDQTFVKVRLPQSLPGERYPRFRQIWIQCTHQANDLIVQIDESDSSSTIYHRTGFFDVSVSHGEGIEIQTLSLRGTGNGTTWEILIMYPIVADGLGLAT